MTEEQDVVTAKERIAKLKAEYMAAVHFYIDQEPKDSSAAKSAALAVQKRGAEYFNYTEEFVGNSDLLGAHDSDFWAQGFAEDCAEILRSMPSHYEFLKEAFKWFPDLENQYLLPGPTSFANMQRMTVAHISKSVVKELRAIFKKDGLPIYGFDNPAKTRRPVWRPKPTFIVGAIASIVVLALVMLIPDPTRFQRAVLWALFALGLAALASEMSGFVELRINKWIAAGGGLAVFVLVYLFSPTDPAEVATTIQRNSPTTTSQPVSADIGLGQLPIAESPASSVVAPTQN